MEENITHEMLAHGIEKLAVLNEGMRELVMAKLESVDVRLEAVERRIETLAERIDRVEFTAWRIEADTNIIAGEMKGTHKVFDNFGERILELEKAVKLI